MLYSGKISSKTNTAHLFNGHRHTVHLEILLTSKAFSRFVIFKRTMKEQVFSVCPSSQVFLPLRYDVILLIQCPIRLYMRKETMVSAAPMVHPRKRFLKIVQQNAVQRIPPPYIRIYQSVAQPFRTHLSVQVYRIQSG